MRDPIASLRSFLPCVGGARRSTVAAGLGHPFQSAEFLAFAVDRIRKAWNVSSMAEAELEMPKAMSYNCAEILVGALFVAHSSSVDAFGFLFFKSAKLYAAGGPFGPGSSAEISLSQSAGRLTLLPVSQRLDTLK
jgi:hypothetical protein